MPPVSHRNSSPDPSNESIRATRRRSLPSVSDVSTTALRRHSSPSLQHFAFSAFPLSYMRSQQIRRQNERRARCQSLIYLFGILFILFNVFFIIGAISCLSRACSTYSFPRISSVRIETCRFQWCFLFVIGIINLSLCFYACSSKNPRWKNLIRNLLQFFLPLAFIVCLFTIGFDIHETCMSWLLGLHLLFIISISTYTAVVSRRPPHSSERSSPETLELTERTTHNSTRQEEEETEGACGFDPDAGPQS